MKIFAGPRGSGRTTALINWCREGPRMLLVANELRKEHIEYRTGGKGTMVVTIRELQHIKPGQIWYELGADDFDEMFLAGDDLSNIRMRIRAISMYSEDYINITPPEVEPGDADAIDGLRQLIQELH